MPSDTQTTLKNTRMRGLNTSISLIAVLFDLYVVTVLYGTGHIQAQIVASAVIATAAMVFVVLIPLFSAAVKDGRYLRRTAKEFDAELALEMPTWAVWLPFAVYVSASLFAGLSDPQIPSLALLRLLIAMVQVYTHFQGKKASTSGAAKS